MTRIYTGAIAATGPAAMSVGIVNNAASPVPAEPAREVRTPSPKSAASVSLETIAAIQELPMAGHAEKETPPQPKAEVRTFADFRAEARLWDRYLSNDPRRIADLVDIINARPTVDGPVDMPKAVSSRLERDHPL